MKFMQNSDLTTFFSSLKDALDYSNATEDRISYFSELLNAEKYFSLSNDDAIEISSYLEQAANSLESIVLDSRDPDTIYNLTALKDFTNDLLNEVEENALKVVLDSENNNQAVRQATGNWLLNKFAGLAE